jgi:sulfur transfer complex TusBCD TusB component (DsrH family)
MIDVWSAPELIEILISLSETVAYPKVRVLFDSPLETCPEYLLLAMSQCKVERGTLMIDELLTILMTSFLGNHVNSIPVLRKLWELNQDLMIRAICELCRHEQKIMNLSRVLDITQEIKESLIKIVYCNDFDFAVSLGVLAGKRDFLHYDVWLKERIK